MLKISAIYIYPIKSLSGISLQESLVEERGLQYDRRWVLVDENQVQITQREHANMALLSVTIVENGLKVWHRTKNLGELFIPFSPQTQEQQLVKIWDDEVLATHVSSEIDQWFQEALQINCRLFFQPTNSVRLVDKKYAFEQEQVSLADGYPILLAGQASIDDLNSRLSEKVSIQRFRPNVVFSGGTAFLEDSMHQFSIGELEFMGVKNCARCPIPNIDPETAVITKDTIKTLASYRTRNQKVYFGQNVLVKKGGIIKVGDVMEIRE